MKISNFLFFKYCLCICLIMIVGTVLFAIFFRSEYFNLIIGVVVLLSLFLLIFLFRSFKEIVLEKDGIYFYNRSVINLFLNSQNRNFISFSYLKECKITYGLPIILSFKYFKSDGKYCVEQFVFLMNNHKAIEFEYLLNKKIWDVN